MSKKKPETEDLNEEVKTAETEETTEKADTEETTETAEPEEATKSAEKTESSEKKKRREKKKHSFNKRGIKHGALSIVLTVVFIAAVVLVNVIVGVMSDRFDTAADLTTAGIYTLDEKTETYLDKTLDSDVTLTVLRGEQEFEAQDSSYKQVNEILKRMEMTGGHVEVNYLDIDQNPNYTSKFKGETLAANYIVVECEKTGRHRIISPYDYFNFDQNYLQYYGAYVVESSNIEQEAVSAMMYTTSDNVVKIAFTEGYGESDSSSALQTLLSRNGYEVETLPLATTAEISSDIDYVVIYAPTIDLDKSQLAKLDKFLDNNGNFGKNVVYFASAGQPKTPNIDEFLSDWGISVGYDVIGQADQNYLISADTVFAHLQQVCDTDYTQTVYGSQLMTFGAYVRPIYLLENSSFDRTVLMKTHDKAFLYPMDEELAEDFDINSAESGEFNDVVVSQTTTESGSKSRVCVIGTEMLASSAFMSYTNANNAEFFVGMWNYISGREQGMTIRAKSLTPATFEMNVKTANSLSIALCIVIPICVIVLGIVIWLRRRHR